MGVYYLFYKGDFVAQNKNGSDFFIAKFDTRYEDEEEMKQEFEKILKEQNWPDTARIVAVPDYAEHPRFSYHNGVVQRFYVV